MTHVSSAAVGTPNTSTATSLTVPDPAGVLTGHTLIIDFLCRGPDWTTTDNAITEPAGWTQFGEIFEAGTPPLRLESFYRHVQNGDVTTRNFTWPTASNAVAVISCHSDLDPEPVPSGESVYIGKPGFSWSHVSGELTTGGMRILRSVFADRSGSVFSDWEDEKRASLKLASDCSILVQETLAEVGAVSGMTRSVTASVSTSVAVIGFYALKAAPTSPGWERDIDVTIG